jgi:AcrR family transcriptional regulator
VADVNGTPRRGYRSPVREESARRTRSRVVAAAAAAFAERGYVATSLADVATAAGVARPTVFAAFGSKPALLRQVLDEALAGDDEPVPVRDRPWFQPVWQAQDPAAVLDAYATVCTLIGSRASRAFEVVRRAADSSPEVGDLWSSLLQNRRAGSRMVLDHLVTVGELRPGLTFEEAVQVLWFFNDPGHHLALVTIEGWSEERFRSWLAVQMRSALLGG